VFFVRNEVLWQRQITAGQESHHPVATYRTDHPIDCHWTHVFYHRTEFQAQSAMRGEKHFLGKFSIAMGGQTSRKNANGKFCHAASAAKRERH